MPFPPLSKSKQKLYASLSSGKLRKRHGLFVAEGRKCVADILPHFSCRQLVMTPEGEDFASQYPEVREIAMVTPSEMKAISTLSTPSDVLAVFEIPEQREATIDSKKLYVVLDGVRDPGNLGTIIRTAHWFGIDTIFASPDSVDLYNPKTVQSTMGSIAGVKVIYTDLGSLFDENPEMPVYGLLLDGADIYRAHLGQSGFILMGNEGKGISGEMRKRITNPLLIPPSSPEHGESLNVAVATAVTLALFRNAAAK